MRAHAFATSGGFTVLSGTERSQAATMEIEPGGSVGVPNNRHERSDQWLFVVSGRGRAVVEGEEFELAPGHLLLVEKGEAHRVECTGDRPPETLNVYAPPPY